ncbi:30S ribosomal protein S8 [Candidatus Gracilibacteria bacterium]|nr:30S ribosomal protein S8 [Candidatus Gracilibacteria bacterium]
MLTDPIADLLIRIKNASRARKNVVEAPYSKIKMEILNILQRKNSLIVSNKKRKS